jgi:hypothetical protein
VPTDVLAEDASTGLLGNALKARTKLPRSSMGPEPDNSAATMGHFSLFKDDVDAIQR